MIFRGLQKTTLIDYPNEVACTLFVDKCNFRCPYCQNPSLVLEEAEESISEREVLEFLRKRKNVLDAVCITGGEPTLHSGLKHFIQRVKELGYKVKLDTNGTNPGMLRELIEEKLADYIAMDIKAPIEKYDKAANVIVDKEAVQKSVELLKSSGIDYEFRTTVVPGILEKKDFEKMGKWLKGAKAFYLQQFEKDAPLLDPRFQKVRSYSSEELEEMKKIMEKYVERVEIRD